MAYRVWPHNISEGRPPSRRMCAHRHVHCSSFARCMRTHVHTRGGGKHALLHACTLGRLAWGHMGSKLRSRPYTYCLVAVPFASAFMCWWPAPPALAEKERQGERDGERIIQLMVESCRNLRALRSASDCPQKKQRRFKLFLVVRPPMMSKTRFPKRSVSACGCWPSFHLEWSIIEEM